MAGSAFRTPTESCVPEHTDFRNMPSGITPGCSLHVEQTALSEIVLARCLLPHFLSAAACLLCKSWHWVLSTLCCLHGAWRGPGTQQGWRLIPFLLGCCSSPSCEGGGQKRNTACRLTPA